MENYCIRNLVADQVTDQNTDHITRGGGLFRLLIKLLILRSLSRNLKRLF